MIPPALNGIVSVSGLEIDQLRVSYTPADDTLSIGVEGPPNGRDGREVIAADSDNNGNSGTVDPRVLAAEPGFQDPPDMGGTKTYGVLLALNNPAVPDIAAGFPITAPAGASAKPYEVALAVNNDPNHPDRFNENALLPQYTGNYYLANDPNHPNFELQVTHFSQLYQQVTGKALTPQTQLSIGAFASSAQSIGISDEFFPPQAITVGNAEPPPVTPPPVPVPGLTVTKTTNGVFAPTAPGPLVATGSTVTWNYDVVNTGTEPLKNVSLVDNGGSTTNPAAAFAPTFAGGDVNGNGLLDPGEDWHYVASGVALAGQYENLATAGGVGVTTGKPVLSGALSHYLATTPTPMVCPPMSPTVYVNPHQNDHINTAHPSAIRVSILGSSGFDPTTIIPSSVKFGDPATIATTGASPILNFERNVNHDQFPDETFVFDGLSVKLPPGITNAEITGTTTSGQTFASTVKVFNRDLSYYTQAQINKQQVSYAKYDMQHNIPITNGNFVAPPPVIPKAAQQLAASMAINDIYNPFKGEKVPRQVNPTALGTAAPASALSGPVVSIPTRKGKAAKAQASGMNMAASMTAQPATTVPVLSGGQ